MRLYLKKFAVSNAYKCPFLHPSLVSLFQDLITWLRNEQLSIRIDWTYKHGIGRTVCLNNDKRAAEYCFVHSLEANSPLQKNCRLIQINSNRSLAAAHKTQGVFRRIWAPCDFLIVLTYILHLSLHVQPLLLTLLFRQLHDTCFYYFDTESDKRLV